MFLGRVGVGVFPRHLKEISTGDLTASFLLFLEPDRLIHSRDISTHQLHVGKVLHREGRLSLLCIKKRTSDTSYVFNTSFEYLLCIPHVCSS